MREGWGKGERYRDREGEGREGWRGEAKRRTESRIDEEQKKQACVPGVRGGAVGSRSYSSGCSHAALLATVWGYSTQMKDFPC